jgi:hypothetical protein
MGRYWRVVDLGLTCDDRLGREVKDREVLGGDHRGLVVDTDLLKDLIDP